MSRTLLRKVPRYVMPFVVATLFIIMAVSMVATQYRQEALTVQLSPDEITAAQAMVAQAAQVVSNPNKVGPMNPPMNLPM